ncbi:MAG TPA: CARDB domain-containing protein [Methylomirabilota bacterium]|nr:CARDB domain-containing protein [Methylomirabilota bacterium]
MNVARCLSLVLLAALVSAAPAAAAPTAQSWEEIGGSASGNGLSTSQLGVVPEHRNVSVVIDSTGRPVVAYTDWADIEVRRWNGTAWEILGRPGNGHLPQLAMDSTGRIYLAWMQFIPATGSWEIYLVMRDPAGGDWQELSGSGSGNGITGNDGRPNINSFSLALAPDGTPWVAYDTYPTAGVDFTSQTSGVSANSQQVFVKRYAGPAAGWVFVGSGRDGGGASNAPSFVFTNADGSANFALHGALSPTLTIAPDGTPVVAFIYTTSFTTGNPPEFNGLNDDIYAVAWNGTAWVALGPAVPSTPDGAGLGAPGGISASEGWSVESYLDRMDRPYIITGSDGAPVLGWGETTESGDAHRVFVRRWNGTTWDGLGSATGQLQQMPIADDLSLAPGLNGPIAAWSAGSSATAPAIHVLAWDSRTSRWTELGMGSSSGTGISGPTMHAFTPWITVDPAGTPTVTWIDSARPVDYGQAYLRTFNPRLLPDLTVTALPTPAGAYIGQRLTISSTVRNVGGGTSASTPLTFYLSTGTAPGAGDVTLGSRIIPMLGVNGTSTAGTTMTIPAGTAPGTYQVIAVVDPAGGVLERNETNNFRASSPIAVTPFRPDLQVASVSAPASGAAGRPLTVTHTLRNVGPAPAGPFVLRFFLSSDTTLDGGDVTLGTRAFGGLAAGAISTLATVLTVPATTPVPATYHVIAVADPMGQVELRDDNDSAASGAIAVTAYLPDLAMSLDAVPASGAAGRPLAVRNTVRNVGPAPAGPFVVRFYLSTDTTFDPGDVLLGSRMLGGLGAGASSTATTTLTIPANTSVPAQYSIIAVADAAGQVTELGEDNNTAASAAINVAAYLPDLTIAIQPIAASAASGATVTVTTITRDLGPAPAGAYAIRFFLSTDAQLDSGDVLLATRTISSLAAGASRTDATTLTVPAGTAAGTYQVLAFVDALGQVTELDETNNLAASTPLSVAAAAR